MLLFSDSAKLLPAFIFNIIFIGATMKNKCGCCKLSAIGLGMAAAVVSALSMLVLGILNMKYGIGAEWIKLVATVYKGYDVTWHGIGLGAGYAAVEGFVGGLLFGWIYNICIKALGKCCKCCQSCSVEKTEQQEKIAE